MSDETKASYLMMASLSREAELGKSYAVERVAGRLIETLNAIGAITGEVNRLAGTVFISQITQRS